MERLRFKGLGEEIVNHLTDQSSFIHLATPVYGDVSLIKNDGIALGTGAIAVKYGGTIMVFVCLYTIFSQ